MSALHIPLLTYAHDDRAVGVLLHRDDVHLLPLAEGRREVLQRALTGLIEKEGVLELIGEDYPDEEDFPRPSPEEASKSLEGI